MSHGFMDKPSEKYKQAVLALRELLRAQGEEDVTRAFAEAIWEARQNTFAKKYGVKLASNSHVCIHRLLGKRCPKVCGSPGMIPAADHCSEWKKDGETVIVVSQPYGLSYSRLKETVAFCEEHGLEASIDSLLSWHFPGSVVSVEYRRAVSLSGESNKDGGG